MRKNKDYERAELEIIRFDEIDIITSSGQLGEPGIDYGGWTKSGDEWS